MTKKQGWRTDTPPEEGLYIVYAPSANPKLPLIAVAFWSTRNMRWELVLELWADAITHWQPLPDPPEEETE